MHQYRLRPWRTGQGGHDPGKIAPDRGRVTNDADRPSAGDVNQQLPIGRPTDRHQNGRCVGVLVYRVREPLRVGRQPPAARDSGERRGWIRRRSVEVEVYGAVVTGRHRSNLDRSGGAQRESQSDDGCSRMSGAGIAPQLRLQLTKFRWWRRQAVADAPATLRHSPCAVESGEASQSTETDH
jgi:hypothetical protein